MDKGDPDASWAQATSMFKQAVTAPQWVDAARRARAPLSAVKQRREKCAQATRTLPDAPDGDYLLLQYDASFGLKAAAVETQTLAPDADGRWRFAGYLTR